MAEKLSNAERIRENYYRVALFFSSAKEDETALYVFLSNLSKRRKTTSFITKVLMDYFKCCGIEEPDKLTYEELIKLPSITEMLGSIAAKNMTIVRSEAQAPVMQTQPQAIVEQPQQIITDTPKAAPVIHEVETAPAPKQTYIQEDIPVIEDDDDLMYDEPMDSEQSVDSSWMQGLSAFMSN